MPQNEISISSLKFFQNFFRSKRSRKSRRGNALQSATQLEERVQTSVPRASVMSSSMAKEPSGSKEDGDAFVLSSRRGSVLGLGTILKSDHFPGAQNKKLRPIVDGAPNFRQVDGLPVYGVAIPTIDGVLNVLKEVCDGDDGERGDTSCCCCWHNMREEPVLYINGKPFVLREMEHPFANVEYTGITSSRVEDMEQRMKRDVLLEVGRFGGIMVCEETEEGDLVNSWEAVEPGDVQVSEVEGLAEPVQDFPPIPSSTRKPLSPIVFAPFCFG